MKQIYPTSNLNPINVWLTEKSDPNSRTAANSAPDAYSFDYIVKAETTATAPYLFIYSAADEIVSASDVEEVSAAKSKSGMNSLVECNWFEVNLW